MTSDDNFSLIIGDLFSLYNAALSHVGTHPLWVAATCRRALGILRNYKPVDEGQEILIETAIENFEELLRKVGGAP